MLEFKKKLLLYTSAHVVIFTKQNEALELQKRSNMITKQQLWLLFSELNLSSTGVCSKSQ